MILKSILLLLAVTYVSADYGNMFASEVPENDESPPLPACSNPGGPLFTGNACEKCTCSKKLAVECTIAPECLNNKAESYRKSLINEKKIDKKIESENITPVTPGPGQICAPGTFYRKYCNSCKCVGNGQIELCTKVFCHDNTYNSNGTLIKKQSFKDVLDEITEKNIDLEALGMPFTKYSHVLSDFETPDIHLLDENDEKQTIDELVDPLDIQITKEELRK